MRLPSFVPAVLVMLGFSLIAGSIFVAVGAVSGSQSDVIETRHSDNNLTFVAATFASATPGSEIRTPGLSDWPTLTFFMDGREVNANQLLRDAPPQVLVLDGGAAPRLVDGDPLVYHETEGVGPLTFQAPPAAPGRSWGPHSIDIVWIVHNDTAEYDERAAALLAIGIEGRDSHDPRFVAIAEGSVGVGRAMRLGGIIAAVAAVVLAMWPRKADGLVALNDGLAGASIALVEAGGGVLERLRNAYLTLVALLLGLGVPVIMALGLFAGTLSVGDMFGGAREQPWDGWQATVWYQLLTCLLAAIIVAARPAIDAHMSLRMWRALAADPPIEGDL